MRVLKEADDAIREGITTEGLREHEKLARKATQVAEGEGSSKKSKLFDLMDKKREIEREILRGRERERNGRREEGRKGERGEEKRGGEIQKKTRERGEENRERIREEDEEEREE